MKLVLQRSYYPDGVNGILHAGDKQICYTIELPWKDNRHGISCIPEGTYPVVKRFSNRHQFHLEVLNVPDRSLILIHKANDAQQELRGCIAPVASLTGPGKGYPSKPAFDKLYQLVDNCLANDEPVELEIRRKE